MLDVEMITPVQNRSDKLRSDARMLNRSNVETFERSNTQTFNRSYGARAARAPRAARFHQENVLDDEGSLLNRTST